jgi:hypothetical protein
MSKIISVEQMEWDDYNENWKMVGETTIRMDKVSHVEGGAGTSNYYGKVHKVVFYSGAYVLVSERGANKVRHHMGAI